MAWGVVLMVLGSVLLADRLGAIDLSETFGPVYLWWMWWPLILMLAGGIRLLTADRLAQTVSGVSEIAIGGWLLACFQHWGGLTFSNSWPIVLIAGGLHIMFGAGSRYRSRRHGVSS
jgi:hypothetical protein